MELKPPAGSCVSRIGCAPSASGLNPKVEIGTAGRPLRGVRHQLAIRRKSRSAAPSPLSAVSGRSRHSTGAGWAAGATTVSRPQPRATHCDDRGQHPSPSWVALRLRHRVELSRIRLLLQLLQRDLHILHRLVAPLRVFAQTALNNSLQLSRHRCRQLTGWFGSSRKIADKVDSFVSP